MSFRFASQSVKSNRPASQPPRELKDLLTLRLLFARHSHHEQNHKNEGFLHLGKPLSKGHRTLSKSDSLISTRPVLITSLGAAVYLHAIFPSSICRISILSPTYSPLPGYHLSHHKYFFIVSSFRMFLLRVRIHKCRSIPYPGTACLRRVFLRILGTCPRSCLQAYYASFHGLQIEVGEHSCHLPWVLRF